MGLEVLEELSKALLFFPKSDKWEWDIVSTTAASTIKAGAVLPLTTLDYSGWVYSGYVSSNDENVGLRVRVFGASKEYKFDVTTKGLADLTLNSPQPGAFHYTKRNAATVPENVFTWTPSLFGFPSHKKLILEKINLGASDATIYVIHMANIKLL